MQFLFFIFFCLAYYLICGYSYNSIIDSFYVVQPYNHFDSSIENIMPILQDNKSSVSEDINNIEIKDLYQNILDSLYTDSNGVIISLWLSYIKLDNLLSSYVVYTQLLYNIFIGTSDFNYMQESPILMHFFCDYESIINHLPTNVPDVEIDYSSSEASIINFVNEITN